MNVGFVIESWEKMDSETNNTLRLIHEACVRKHKVGILYPRNLTIRNNVVFGFFKVIQVMEKVPENFVTFHKKAVLEDQMLPLQGFDALLVRNKPPIDSLMLNFLDALKDEVFILNDIDGMRKANNKTYTTSFYDPENTFLPVTHVSKNQDYLIKIIKNSPAEKMILKPLHGNGGNGVIVLEKSAMRNIRSLLEFYTTGSERDYVIVQEYVDGADYGDVRVLMLNGKAIGAYRRVPSDEDFRANIHAGGKAVKHDLSDREKEICKLIGPRLVADGLYLVGVDLIGEKLIEINVLNPGGIVNINRLCKTRLQAKVFDFIEESVNAREAQLNDRYNAISRRLSSRQEVAGD